MTREEEVRAALAQFRSSIENGKPPKFALRDFDLKLVLTHIDELEEKAAMYDGLCK
jgi:hypothetical protein